jgi:hypothetical protein
VFGLIVLRRSVIGVLFLAETIEVISIEFDGAFLFLLLSVSSGICIGGRDF